ncbi:MAG: M20/M25/M40 family metallo-hydrolase [Acidobacteriota bacterium]
MKKSFVLIVLVIISVFSLVASNGKYLKHEIKAEIFPSEGIIKVTDNIIVPTDMLEKKLHFLLHGNLKITGNSPNIKIRKESGEIKSKFFGINTAEFKITDKIPVAHYSIKTGKGENSFKIEYSGKINHPVKMIGEEYARGFKQTPGIISSEGVYLAGSTFWVPWFNENLVTFKLNTIVNKEWSVASQGKLEKENIKDGKMRTTWDSPEPMDEIYLIAAKFARYKIKVSNVNIVAYMRTNDDNLAMKYLNTTGQYLEMYQKLIGKYPYTKFALIENFWETGYGMPSFTLLGPKVIRFPFILHSSYPHELLHNWWGNSVFVNYNKGNWCEGLTVYMADHLIKEQRGQGTDYRKTTLQGYTDYVNDENEFPVKEFKARFDSASSSIGYGKSMMTFNMLRTELGDKIFLKAIQDFYSKNKYKRATFNDIRESFEKVSGKKYSYFFDQWINRKGAPQLKMEDTKLSKVAGDHVLNFKLKQLQKDDPYKMNIPAIVYFEGDSGYKKINLKLSKKSENYKLRFKDKPYRIDIDPWFDVFRRLSEKEITPALSKAFGATKILILLPSKGNEMLNGSYKKLAENWAGERKGKIEIKYDDQITDLPGDSAVWIFGRYNKFAAKINKNIEGYGSDLNESEMRVGKKSFDLNKNSVVLSMKNPKNLSNVIVFMSADNSKAVQGLGRKLPHYGKYSYLVFSGDEPTVSVRGQWEVKDSPLIKVFNNNIEHSVKVKKREPLGKLEALFSKEKMSAHVKYLSSKELKGRGIGTEGIDKAADYIAGKFKAYGLKPGGDNGSFFQTWKQKIKKNNKEFVLKNIIGYIPGKNKEWKDQSVILCAHYDHLGLGWPDVRPGNEGKVHPGADDNSSGISVMLEMARSLARGFTPDRSIIFVAFTAEESGLIGSKYYADNYKKFPVKDIFGVINLDTVGRLNNKKPMIIGGNSAKEWKFLFMGIGFTNGIETDLITQDLDASDQISFVKKGIPGVQIFSGPHLDYHRPTDTFDKIDIKGMVKIAKVTKEAVVYLSQRKEKLAFTGKTAAGSKMPVKTTGKGKKVSIGIMPDFAFSKPGVRVGMAIKGASGKEHVLKKGDIIKKIDDHAVNNLREYTTVLKKYSPGEIVTITFEREGKVHTEKIKLRQR